MNTFAIHSPNDADLLIRLHDDLVKAGFESETEWNRQFYPKNDPVVDDYGADPKYDTRLVRNFTLVAYDTNVLNYHCHDCDNGCEEHRDLTKSNYTSILEEIIQANKPQDADYGQQSI